MKRSFELQDLKDIAQEILTLAEERGAFVIALHGDLGAGKTTLTQTLARELGVKETVISPTFVIMKRYPITHSHYKNLIHIDAYRLKNESELQKLGWEEILGSKENLIVIEWPERVPALIPENSVRIELEHSDEHTRTIVVY